jgi:hypothetical protein
VKEQLVDDDQFRPDVVFYVGLLEIKFSQLFDLKNLAKQHQQAILLNSPVPEKNLSLPN